MGLRQASEAAEQFVLEVIEGKRRDFKARMFTALLLLLSRLFKNIVIFRYKLYSWRILRYRTLGCLVVSIGNLTAGGTGKTPVTEVFARRLSERGRRVAILSRGYRSKSKPFKEKLKDFFLRRKDETPPRIVSRGDGKVLLKADMAGDEPYMLACNVPKAAVLTDKDRVKSGRYAIRNFGTDTLLLDDGFQQLRLQARINIVLVDSTNPFSNHNLLPRGLLREPISNLKRADFIFLTKSNGGAHLRHLKRFLRKHNRRAEIIECRHCPKYLQDVYGEERMNLEQLRGKKISAISGIAVPESFEKFLTGYGAEIIYKERYVDHHRYSRSEIEGFLKKSKDAGAEIALTTEKDAVRFPDVEKHVQTFYLRIEIDILSGHENFNQCIDRICFK